MGMGMDTGMGLGVGSSVGERVMRVEDMRRSRVVCVAEDGLVVLRLPDGTSRIVTIPRESVTYVRRLADIDREIDRIDLALRDS
jgi:hypothetical protein